jgi:hypothetical protein
MIKRSAAVLRIQDIFGVDPDPDPEQTNRTLKKEKFVEDLIIWTFSPIKV